MGALTFDALLRSLKQGAPDSVYYLHGEEDVLKDEAVRAVQERAHRLVLQHVFLAVEIVDGIRGALLQAPKQRVKGESPHTGRKLPWPRGERKPTDRRTRARRPRRRPRPGAPRTRSRAGPGTRRTAHRSAQRDSGRERAGARGRGLRRDAGRLPAPASRAPPRQTAPPLPPHSPARPGLRDARARAVRRAGVGNRVRA